MNVELFFARTCGVRRGLARTEGQRTFSRFGFPGFTVMLEAAIPRLRVGFRSSPSSAKGLLVDHDRVEEVMGRRGTNYVAADCDAMIHDSLTLGWRPAEIIPKRHWNWEKGREERRMNLARRRTLPLDPLVHAAAFDRRGYTVPPGAARVETTQW
jgi:hypothetical protein